MNTINGEAIDLVGSRYQILEDMEEDMIIGDNRDTLDDVVDLDENLGLQNTFLNGATNFSSSQANNVVINLNMESWKHIL